MSFYIRTAGDHLILATDHYFTGFVISFVGVGLMGLSTTMMDSKESMIFASFISLVGITFMVESHSHYKKAGLILNQNGVGLKIKL